MPGPSKKYLPLVSDKFRSGHETQAGPIRNPNRTFFWWGEGPKLLRYLPFSFFPGLAKLVGDEFGGATSHLFVCWREGGKHNPKDTA